MGSAPASGSFEGRLGSSARRGAYVAPGMHGVYRVTRSRTTQARTLPRARPNLFPWIPQEGTDHSTNLIFAGMATGGDLVTTDIYTAESQSVLINGTGDTADPIVFSGDRSGYFRTDATDVSPDRAAPGAGYAVALVNPTGVSRSTPDPDDTPDGMHVEYRGDGLPHPVSVHIFGDVGTTRSSGSSGPEGATLLAAPGSTWNPFVAAPYDLPDWWTPTELAAFETIQSVSGAAAGGGSVTTTAVDFTHDIDDVTNNGSLVLILGFDCELDGNGWALSLADQTVSFQDGFGDSMLFAVVTFSQPDYRYVPD